jgi:hypothetical protein
MIYKCDKESRRRIVLSLNLDVRDGILRTIASGPYDRYGTEKYLLDLEDALAFSRRKWGCVRHLIDARKAKLRSDINYHCIAGASIELYGPADRTAAVMPSERAIIHVGEMPSHFRTAAFRTTAEAVAWLKSGSKGELELL